MSNIIREINDIITKLNKLKNDILLNQNISEIIECIKLDPNLFPKLNTQLRALKEIVLEAVKQNGLALQFAGQIVKNDIEITLEAIKQNALAIQYSKWVMKL